jgi:hypothetical protein
MWAGYVAAVLLLVQLAALRVRGGALQWGVTVLAIVTAIMVVLAGFTGGKIRHAAPLEGGSSGGPVEPFVPIPESRPTVE